MEARGMVTETNPTEMNGAATSKSTCGFDDLHAPGKPSTWFPNVMPA